MSMNASQFLPAVYNLRHYSSEQRSLKFILPYQPLLRLRLTIKPLGNCAMSTTRPFIQSKNGMDILNTEKDLEADQPVLDLPLFHKAFTFCLM